MLGITPSKLFFVTCIATVALYFQVLLAPYYFDDFQAFGGDLDNVSTPSWGSIASPQERPLLQLLFSVCSFFSSSPLLIYRINGLVIHLANGLLLWRFVQFVSGQRTATLDLSTNENGLSSGDWTGAIVATIWLIHPLGVQTVGSIVQQAESLMTTCFIGYLFVIAKVANNNVIKSAALAHSLLILGLYLKVVMVVAVPAGVLLDAALTGRSIRAVLRDHWIVHLPPLAACITISIALVPMLIRAKGGVGFGGDAPPVLTYLMTCTRSLVRYLSLAIWPRELAIDRGPHWLVTIQQMLPWGLCVLAYTITACVLWFRRRAVHDIDNQLLGWLLLMPLIVLAPTSTMIPTADPIFEHRFYLPLAFIVWFVVYFGMRAWDNLLRNQRHLVILSLCFVLTALSARTFLRTRDFLTLESIWRTALEVDPDNDRAAQNWVLAMQEANREVEIIPRLNELLRFAKDAQKEHEAVEHQLAKAYLREGNVRVATDILLRLSTQIPRPDDLITDRQRREHGELAFDLSIAFVQQGESHRAMAAVEYAMQCTPDDPIVLAVAGDLSIEMNKPEDARRYWSAALKRGSALLPEIPSKLRSLEATNNSSSNGG